MTTTRLACATATLAVLATLAACTAHPKPHVDSVPSPGAEAATPSTGGPSASPSADPTCNTVSAPASTNSHTIPITVTLCATFPAGTHLWIVAVASGKYYAKTEFTHSGTYQITLASDTKHGSTRNFEIVEATNTSDEDWLLSDHDNDGNPNFTRTTLHGTVISNAAPNTFNG
jgi:hypothetical protein